jgi:hypothetical protein
LHGEIGDPALSPLIVEGAMMKAAINLPDLLKKLYS